MEQLDRYFDGEFRTLYVDVETFSDVSLKDCGVDKYVESENYEMLLLAYAFDDEDVEVIELSQSVIPPHVKRALTDPRITKVAHNARFERICLGKTVGEYMSPEQWVDSMVLASSCGLPLSLEAVGGALGLSEEESKMKEGKALLRYFCLPCKPTKTHPEPYHTWEDDEEKWKTFIEYNRRDVETERIIYKKLLKWRPDYSEHKLWIVDQTINDRGMRVDLDLANNAINIGNAYKEQLMKRATDISGIVNPNSSEQVKAWLKETEGFTVDSLNKKVISEVVGQLTSDSAKEFMELRSEFSKSSVKKYEAIARCTTEDGHIHGCFLMDGAGRTGRWAGRLVQLQNLPHDTIPDIDTARELVRTGDADTFELLYPDVQSTLSMLIRPTLIPEEGHQFLVADFSAIEARVLAWLAGEDWRLDVFNEGGDIYCASASQMFKVPVVKNGENGHLRSKGKVAELALGYGGSIGALKAFGADKMGMTEEEMGNTVAMWREASPHITALWKSLERSAMRCVAHKMSTISTVGHIRFDYEDGVMWMSLPSGRRIAYWGAGIGENKFGEKSLTYMGTDQKTKKWARLETFGGKLVENLTQATARDCLKAAMLNMYDEGYDIRGTVHDEVIVTEPINGRSCEELCALMGRPIEWAPGLPLRADGYACSSYRKD